jgi:hypothetical protein
MIRSRSTPTGSRSYAEELEIIQRKRADKAMKRYPISPEGPRASEVVSTSSNTIMFSCNKTFLAGFLTLRCRSSMLRSDHQKSPVVVIILDEEHSQCQKRECHHPKNEKHRFLYNPSLKSILQARRQRISGQSQAGSHRHRDRGDLQI